MRLDILLCFFSSLVGSESCTNEPYPRIYGANDGDLVLNCVDVGASESFLGGYTTANSITSRGSTSKALMMIIDKFKLDVKLAFLFDTSEFSSF